MEKCCSCRCQTCSTAGSSLHLRCCGSHLHWWGRTAESLEKDRKVSQNKGCKACNMYKSKLEPKRLRKSCLTNTFFFVMSHQLFLSANLHSFCEISLTNLSSFTQKKFVQQIVFLAKLLSCFVDINAICQFVFSPRNHYHLPNATVSFLSLFLSIPICAPSNTQRTLIFSNSPE